MESCWQSGTVAGRLVHYVERIEDFAPLAEITRIGVLAHPLRPQSYPIAHQMKATLEANGIESFVYTDWKSADVEAAVKQADMVIAIGGDGAMLRASRVCAPCGVPVLGVNMGQLGFLTEIADPEHWDDQLGAILKGEYWIEDRMMLHADVMRGGEIYARGEALNDMVISGSVFGGMIELETFIDDDWATTYNADALVIASATGSTAYALALGGPILPPQLKNILILPAAPHLSMDRPIVLSEGARVEVIATPTRSADVMLTADGMKVGMILPEDRVRVQASERTSRFVRLRGRNYFYRSLLDRLEPRVQRSRNGDAPDAD